MINFEKLTELYRQHNEKRVADNYFLGSICSVWNRDGLLWTDSAGYADLRKTTPLKPNSMFRLASMTKPIAGAALMQQVEKGLIGLDDPIYKWLPSYEKLEVATKIENGKIVETESAKFAVTPRHLLYHGSGIGSGDSAAVQYPYIKRVESLAESVESYAKSILEFHPGTTRAYSPYWGFDIIARLVEVITDTPYDAYIQKNFLDPLGMVDTTYLPNDEQITRTVDFISTSTGKMEKVRISPRTGHLFGTVESSHLFGEVEAANLDGFVAGGAGLFSSMEDYRRFAQMLLNEGEWNGHRFLEKDTVKQMRTHQVATSLTGEKTVLGWGLSMRCCLDGQTLPKGAYGWSGSYGTHFWVDPVNDITCVYMMNLENGGGSGEPAALEFEADVMASMK